MPSAPPEGWEKVGIITLLVIAISLVGWVFLSQKVVPGMWYQAKVQECDEERERADRAEQRYVDLLKADIEERKGRDRTLEFITKAASRGGAEDG